MKRFATLFFALGLFHSAAAQESTPSDTTPTTPTWRFGVNLGTLNIDSQTAFEQGIDDSAFSLSAYAHYLNNDWIGTAGLDFYGYDDNNSFEQDVNSRLFGDSRERSSASAFALFGAFGKRWYSPDNAVNGYAQLGYNIILESERGINNCSNCFSEDIDVDGGVFARVGSVYSWDRFGLGLQYTQYLTGDLDSSIALAITSSFK